MLWWWFCLGGGEEGHDGRRVLYLAGWDAGFLMLKMVVRVFGNDLVAYPVDKVPR